MSKTELKKDSKNKPWGGREPVVIDGHFDNPTRKWNGDICSKCGTRMRKWFDRQEFTGYKCDNCGEERKPND